MYFVIENMVTVLSEWSTHRLIEEFYSLKKYLVKTRQNPPQICAKSEKYVNNSQSDICSKIFVSLKHYMI